MYFVFFVVEVSNPCSSNYFVCDGVWYTHSVVSRTFFCTALHTSAHLHACEHTRMTQVCVQSFVACACRWYPSRLLHPHVSPSILAVPWQSLRVHFPDFDVTDILAELYPNQRRGSSTLPPRSLATWLPRTPHGELLLICNGVRSHLSLAWEHDHLKKPCRPRLSSALSVRIYWWFFCWLLRFSDCWTQLESSQMLLCATWQWKLPWFVACDVDKWRSSSVSSMVAPWSDLKATSIAERHRGKLPREPRKKRVYQESCGATVFFSNFRTRWSNPHGESIPCNALLQAHTMPFRLTSIALVLCAAFGSTYLGFPQFCGPVKNCCCQLGQSRQGLARIHATHKYDRAHIYALSP